MKIIHGPRMCTITDASPRELTQLSLLLGYRAVAYRQGVWRKERKEYWKSLVQVVGKHRAFLSGFLPRVKNWSRQKRMDLYVEDHPGLKTVSPDRPPHVPGVVLRPDQIRLIQDAVNGKRGIIKAPTGVGKTIIALGILSCFPRATALVLTHSTSIMNQLDTALKKHGFDLDKIRVATRQSITNKKNIKPGWGEFLDSLDILIVDECHLFGTLNGQYARICLATKAPIRVGLTATPPTKPEIAMTLEGHIGPIMANMEYHQSEALAITAGVKLEFVSFQPDNPLRLANTYPQVEESMEYSMPRNMAIVQKAKELTARGLSVLIFTKKISHGDRLEKIGGDLGLEILKVRGATPEEVRENIKHALMNDRPRCVVSTQVWREGVDIPNLGAVILAHGGKSEMSTLQAIGRGLRRTGGKEQAVIVDVIDTAKYLSQHFAERMAMYHEKGWI